MLIHANQTEVNTVETLHFDNFMQNITALQACATKLIQFSFRKKYQGKLTEGTINSKGEILKHF